jgi:hypothetical protein
MYRADFLAFIHASVVVQLCEAAVQTSQELSQVPFVSRVPNGLQHGT